MVRSSGRRLPAHISASALQEYPPVEYPSFLPSFLHACTPVSRPRQNRELSRQSASSTPSSVASRNQPARQVTPCAVPISRQRSRRLAALRCALRDGARGSRTSERERQQAKEVHRYANERASDGNHGCEQGFALPRCEGRERAPESQEGQLDEAHGSCGAEPAVHFGEHRPRRDRRGTDAVEGLRVPAGASLVCESREGTQA